MTKLDILNHSIYNKDIGKPIHHTLNRIKSHKSIEGKLKRLGLSDSVMDAKDNLTDIAGIRVICHFPEEIYDLVKCLKRQSDLIVIKEKDYIKNPKPSGYRSFHLVLNVPVHLSSSKTTVPVEIQIRTIAMDFWASLEHQLRYKPTGTITPEISEELRQCAERIAETDIQMQKLYTEINDIN